MPLSQRDRALSVTTPLGEDVLLLRRMRAHERLGTPFEYVLDLSSEDLDIAPSDLLGQSATVSLRLRDGQGERRYFNGWVSRFSHTGFDGADALYQATVVPWLWFLSRTADCRIFQEQTVPDIVKSIFREHGYTDFEERLSASYRQWTYCVQYRETDLSFVSRLMEQEGIYYFFEHEDGRHRLILADGYSAHASVSGYEDIPYYPPDATAVREREHVSRWSLVQQVRSGAFAHTAFDFTAPRKDLQSKRQAPKPHEQADFEVFDYQGDYTEHGDGDAYARVRLEELQVDQEQAEAESNARGLGAGALFNLTGYRREDQNREYLIVSADYRLQSDAFGSSQSERDEPVFVCTLGAIDARTPYRPPRATEKPVVRGPQTAIVVGQSGEEIWTDEYGRVKVQFHWDRYGKRDQDSSCWVRVSHPWAGKNWGAIAIPRIGQEVVVSFLEGDPDQPLITGRVYNGDAMPPYDLPANQTQSGLKSRSSKGGGTDNFNELRFEDMKGEEQVYLHAERNLDSVVEADETREVGHDRRTEIGNDELLQVAANRTTEVAGDFQETVDGSETRTVHGSVSETVNGGETRTINTGATETINGGETRTVVGALSESISGSVTQSVGASVSETVGGSLSQSVGGSVSLTAGGTFTITATGGMTIIAPGGTKIVDFELCQVGGTIKEGYASKLDFNGLVMEVNGVKAEATGSANAVVGLKFEKVGADLGADDVLQKSYALACLSEATGIEMATLKVLM